MTGIDLFGVFQLSADWIAASVRMPPDNHEPIELRFGRDPGTLHTTGRVMNRLHATFGPPGVPVFWRPAIPSPKRRKNDIGD